MENEISNNIMKGIFAFCHHKSENRNKNRHFTQRAKLLCQELPALNQLNLHKHKICTCRLFGFPRTGIKHAHVKIVLKKLRFMCKQNTKIS